MVAPVQPGNVLLGKYRIEHVLGQGGMGVVVAARHQDLGELFAVKFLLPEALKDEEAVGRFLREARASARLKGEHVARVHDVGRLENGAPYMLMEHLSGSDLKQLVRSRGPLPPGEAITYLLQACDAIGEAHALGIVHRDLKPANMFLVRRPSGAPCVKVLDFGISKQMTPDNVDLTRTGAMLGSPLYMSPEQMFRTKQVDARSDIWALGVVLYELVTGTVPFLSETLTELVGLVLQEEPILPSQRRPGLPPALDAVVSRCLQKKPEHRFQSIEELMQALRALLGSVGPWDRASSPSHPSLPFIPAGLGQTPRAFVHTPPGGFAHTPTGGFAHTPPGGLAHTPPGGLPRQTSSGAFPMPGAPPAGPPPGFTGNTWNPAASRNSSGGGAGKIIVAALGAAASLIVLAAVGIWFSQRDPEVAPASPSAAPASLSPSSPPTSNAGPPPGAPPIAPAPGTPSAAIAAPPTATSRASSGAPSTPVSQASTSPTATATATAKGTSSTTPRTTSTTSASKPRHGIY
ncbi:serine/threonine protein kinase [Chondromyces apiculatus]|uniref:non-specific serine/threonine protein kinase n=1 Tax=Chondromyces apiculatus DSM 436 TaxID=1192034 RepID=A0A017SXF2_9BACT|nr:serine/threonine-protein kinase [Chondromyces apiculatus]EYF01654.1 Serine/threonine-protein kinase pkn3 [Chondromyces apiculatus DSM 436]